MTANGMSGPTPVDWRRKRKRRVLAIIGGLLLAIVVITVWPRSGDPGTDELATSDFREPKATIDTSPFTLPENDGPTTIPEDQLVTTTDTAPPTAPPTPPPTTTPPPPTTTIPPTTTTTLVPLPASHPDPICNGFIDLITLTREARGGLTADGPEAARTLASLARRLRSLDRSAYADASDSLDRAAARLRRASSVDEIRAIMEEVIAPNPEFAAIIDHATRVCPEILAAAAPVL